MISMAVLLYLFILPGVLVMLAYAGASLYRRIRDNQLAQALEEQTEEPAPPQIPQGVAVEFVEPPQENPSLKAIRELTEALEKGGYNVAPETLQQGCCGPDLSEPATATQEGYLGGDSPDAQYPKPVVPNDDPEEESPRRRLRHKEAMAKWKKLLEIEVEKVPNVGVDAYGNPIKDKRLSAIAHNDAYDKLELWLEGSAVTHPTGNQTCDVLAMIGRKDVPPPEEPKADLQKFGDTLVAVEKPFESEAFKELFTESLNKMMDRAVEGVTARAASAVVNAVENEVKSRLLNAVEDKVKSVVRDLLKETLAAAADKAVAEAKAAEEKAKVKTCGNCEDLSDQDMFEGMENCGCPTRPGVIALEEERRRKLEDDAFYQQVLVEEAAKLEALRRQEDESLLDAQRNLEVHREPLVIAAIAQQLVSKPKRKKSATKKKPKAKAKKKR